MNRLVEVEMQRPSNMNHKLIHRFINALTVVALIWVAYGIFKNLNHSFQWRGTKISKSFTLFSTSGELVSWPKSQSQVLVFWASWCGPCSVELKRIDKMVASGDISSQQVIAVAIEEKDDLVQIKKNRGYHFELYRSLDPSLAQYFKVDSTPSVFFLDNDLRVLWFTNGVSPLLEIYFKIFLKGA